MRTATILFCFCVLLASDAAGKEETRERSVTDLVKALKTGDERTRIEAAREIAERKITSSRAASALRELMLTDSGEVLLAAADALARTGAKMTKTIKELTPQLAAPEPEVRARAAWALSLIPTARSAASELAPLVEEEDAWVRVSAASALLRFGHESDRTEKLLVDALCHTDARVRLRAIDGLRYLLGESKPAIAALAKVATEGGPDGVRACRTLAELGPGARSALPTLRALFDSSDPLLAHAAAQAFGSLGPDAVKHVPEFLDRLLIVSPELAVLTVALVSMGEAAVPALIRAVEEGDTIRQRRAARILELLGPKAAAAVPALMREVPAVRPRSKLYDDVSYMQAAVIRALGRIGKAARPALPALEALARTEPGQKFQAEAEQAVFLIRSADR